MARWEMKRVETQNFKVFPNHREFTVYFNFDDFSFSSRFFFLEKSFIFNTLF